MGDTFKPPPEPVSELGRYRILSSTAGIRVSPLAIGCLSLGDAWHDWLGAMSKEASFNLLDAFYQAGGNFIDTANNYQDEQSETIVGEWMAERKNRDMMVVATKYTTNYRSHAEGKGKTVNYSGNHKKSLHMSIRASLRKLQTNYIDILYLHWWDWTTSVKEIMDSLHILVEQGKVLYLGISDAPAWIVATANEYAASQGKTPFSIYQGRWNVMRRDFEREIIPMARHFGMALAPWDVLGGGQFQSPKQIEERKRNGKPLRAEQTPKEAKMSAALERVAKEHDIDSLSAIAIAYVIQKASKVIPIVGARTIEQLHGNIKALSIRLTTEQIRYLEDQIAFDVGFPSDFVGESPAVTGYSPRLVSLTAHIAYPSPSKPFAKDKEEVERATALVLDGRKIERVTCVFTVDLNKKIPSRDLPLIIDLLRSTEEPW